MDRNEIMDYEIIDWLARFNRKEQFILLSHVVGQRAEYTYRTRWRAATHTDYLHTKAKTTPAPCSPNACSKPSAKPVPSASTQTTSGVC